MNFRRLIYTIIAAASIVLLSACSDSKDWIGERQSGDVYVQLRIAVSGENAVTRSNDPMGGDNGNGREVGINNENMIHNVTLLLFKDLTESPVAQVVTFAAHELKSDNSIYETYPHKLTLKFGNYHAVVIANVNEDLDFTGKTFEEVANMVVTKPWVDFSTIDNTNLFTMTSVRDVTVNIQPTSDDTTLGTYQKPFTVDDITIERLAARIDMDATGSKNGDDFTYDYKNKSGSTIGTVAVKELKVVNLLNSGTFALKHFSAKGDGSDIKYYDSEGTSPTQSKYVWDTKSSMKTTTATPDYYTLPMPGNLQTGIAWSASPTALKAEKTVVSGEDAGHKYFILSYAQENTLPAMNSDDMAVMLPKYATALAVHYTITEGGVTSDHYDCYYLKHNNNGDVMRYSVVRNNIYRVTIVPPIKDIREFDINIKVKKWDLFEHAPIYM